MQHNSVRTTTTMFTAIIKIGRASQTQIMNILLLRSFTYVAYIKSKSNYVFQPFYQVERMFNQHE